MRWFNRGAAVVALAALALPAAARADELLVMPYSCSVIGGQPVLTPGPEQGHRIYGQRDQRKYQSCSPVNPDMCRTWTVHRFDLDCDGTRVSWVSVVAASNEGSRRAWLLDGRLVLRMGARWSLAPDDPCAQEPGSDERPIYGGRLRRQCAERLAMAPPPVVEMPFGYAPMLGIDGIFVTAAPPPPGVAKTSPQLPPLVAGDPAPKSATMPDAKPPKSASADTKPPSPLPEAREPKASPPKIEDPKPKEAQQLPLPPPPVPVTTPVPSTTPKVASTAPTGETHATKADGEPKPPAPPKVAVAPPPSPKESAPKESSPGVSHGPRLVTIPPSPPAPVSEVQKTATPPSEKHAGDAPPAPKPVAQASPDGSGDTASGPGVLGMLRPTTTGAIVAFAGLALGLLAAFALARRREQAEDAGRRRRDISALSLDGRHAKPARRGRGKSGVPAHAGAGAPGVTAATSSPAHAKLAATQPVPPRPRQPADPAGASPAAAELPDWSDRMPRTREEALEVLGIGIAPSANAAAIKKIVDGLRMSWHPDHATDETDRTLREHRSKQINVAWAILQGQRAEV